MTRKNFAKSFGGETVTILTETQLMDTMNHFNDMWADPIWPKDGWSYGNYITPYTDRYSEGSYTYKDDPEIRPYLNWHLKEPDGVAGENCLVNMVMHE